MDKLTLIGIIIILGLWTVALIYNPASVYVFYVLFGVTALAVIAKGIQLLTQK